MGGGGGGGVERRHEGSVRTPLEFILTMEGYAVCLAGEGEDDTRAVWERQAYTVYICLAGERRKYHEGGMGTTAGAGVHSDHRGLYMLYVLQEKGRDVTRAVWGRQLVFILTIEGYPTGEMERRHEGRMGTPAGVHSDHRGLSCRRKAELARGRYRDSS